MARLCELAQRRRPRDRTRAHAPFVENHDCVLKKSNVSEKTRNQAVNLHGECSQLYERLFRTFATKAYNDEKKKNKNNETKMKLKNKMKKMTYVVITSLDRRVCSSLPWQNIILLQYLEMSYTGAFVRDFTSHRRQNNRILSCGRRIVYNMFCIALKKKKNKK